MKRSFIILFAFILLVSGIFCGYSTSVQAASRPKHTIMASAGAHGIINPSGKVSVTDGKNKTFTMRPDSGYKVDSVMVDSDDDAKVSYPRPVKGKSIGSAQYTFTNITSDHTINVTFTIDDKAIHTIKASAKSHGSIFPSGKVEVAGGERPEFIITPDPNYYIDDVKVDGKSVGAVASYTFDSVTEDHKIVAKFAKGVANIITASADSHGSISPSGDVSVADGDNQSFTIKPDHGCNIEDVLVDEISIGAVDSYTFENVTSDHTIHARFTSPTYKITATADAHGSISPSGQVDVADGENQSFIISPDQGYRVANVMVDGLSVGAVTSYTFENVTADHTIHARFTVLNHIITATAGPNGSISPSGQVSVDDGNSQTFVITPAFGYHITNVMVDGSSIGTANKYTFYGVDRDHQITASFAKNQTAPTTTPQPEDQSAIARAVAQSWVNQNKAIIQGVIPQLPPGATLTYVFDIQQPQHVSGEKWKVPVMFHCTVTVSVQGFSYSTRGDCLMNLIVDVNTRQVISYEEVSYTVK